MHPSPCPYTVEVQIVAGDVACAEVRRTFERLLGNIAALEASPGGRLLLAMPAISEPDDRDGLVLTWVSLHAENPAGAIEQVISVLLQLAPMTPSLARAELRIRAYDDTPAE